MMSMKLARERAAQAWCKPATSHIEMNPELAEAFAEILDEVWSQPWLGNATTAQLLEELKVRAEVHGYANYRTVDPERTLGDAVRAARGGEAPTPFRGYA